MLALCLLVAFSHPIGWWGVLLLLCCAAFPACGIRGNNRLLRQFEHIAKNSAIHKTDEVELVCPKIGYLLAFEMASRARFSEKLYGIALIDGRNKYYYFWDVPLRYTKENVERMRQKFACALCIQCYEGTSIIRTIENDPYFLRIQE